MSLLSIRSEAFITPDTHEMPVPVQTLTTTRIFPKAPPREIVISNALSWPRTTHTRGALLEADFSRHGCNLPSLLPSAPLWLHQMHGINVVEIGAIDIAALRQKPPAADAAITRTTDTVLAILTADCLPVVIASEDSQTLAAAHAGWRGLAAGILENTVRQMACPPEQLSVWLGPAIGPAAFEVGEEVFQAFDAGNDRDAAACFASTKTPAKWHADLYALARLRLQRLGVSRISGGAWCTYSDATRFFSYRRQRDEGRMATFAWIRTSNI